MTAVPVASLILNLLRARHVWKGFIPGMAHSAQLAVQESLVVLEPVRVVTAELAAPLGQGRIHARPVWQDFIPMQEHRA